MIPAQQAAESNRWFDRLRAAALHLLVTALFAAFAAALVFGLWYPAHYAQSSGGASLFALLIMVDLVLGPLLSLIIYNRCKPKSELVRDYAIVATLQLAALLYGVHTMSAARPVFVVWEYSRFRVVHANEVASAPPDLFGHVEVLSLPWAGPRLKSLRPFFSPQEEIELTASALESGVSLSARPQLWQEYGAALGQIRAASRPVAVLLKHAPERAADVQRLLSKHQTAPEHVGFAPFLDRQGDWVMLVDLKTAQTLGVVQADAFSF